MISEILPSIFAMVFCILMSAYFSATETAFSSLNKIRIKVLAESGNRRAQLTYRLSEDYDRLISTILIGNNIVNIAVASIGTLLFVKLYGDIGATLSTVVVTVVVLIFGEITPKRVAKDFPEKFAMFSAPLIYLLIRVLKPINFLFSQWKKLVSRLLKTEEDAKMSQEELMLLLEEAQRDGSIDQDEGALLKNAVEFRDLRAEDILTPRVDLKAVSIEATKEEIAAVFAESHFSRLLVFDGDIDRIVGVVHQKDFYTGRGITEKALCEIISPPIFVRPMEKVNDLLKHLQAHKSHIAAVIDEYAARWASLPWKIFWKSWSARSGMNMMCWKKPLSGWKTAHIWWKAMRTLMISAAFSISGTRQTAFPWVAGSWSEPGRWRKREIPSITGLCISMCSRSGITGLKKCG